MVAFASVRSFPGSLHVSLAAIPPDIAKPPGERRAAEFVEARSARRAFKEPHPCLATRSSTGAFPGYVIDHVRALKHVGTDTPNNLQWQTVAKARAKDRVE
jgi:hypothetical protein